VTEPEAIRLARIEEKLTSLCKKVDALDNKLDVQYITRAEFCPVQRVVYGIVALALATVVGAVIKMAVS